mgnify:CR=1 FL=1
MNEKNRKRQAEKKRLDQKKMLLQMKKEIESLESEIKHSSFVNARIGTIRNLKISARVLQKVAPYALTAGIIAGGFTLLGDIPFYPNDEWKVYSNVMTEFDNYGNIRTEQQYDSFEDENDNTLDSSDSMLYYYSNWEKNDDGFYSRIVQAYSIKNKTYEDIIKFFGEENINLEDVLGEPSSNIKETRNNLTNEELQEESFVKAVIYNKDENDYIMHKETVGENILFSVLYVLITGLCELAPLYWRSKHSNFDFADCVEKIKRKHQSLDIDSLTKKLELKKDNYNRLMR